MLALAVLLSSAPFAVAAAAQAEPPVFAGVAVRGEVVEADAIAAAEALRATFAARGAKVVSAAEAAASAERERRVMRDLDERLDDAARAAAAAEAVDDWHATREILQDALGVFEADLAYTEDDAAWARYREILLLTAEAQLEVKDVRAADRALAQLLAIEPDYQPQKSKVGDALFARFVAVKDEGRADKLVSLEIKSRPPGAKVLVDGRRAGRAPVAVDLPTGVHYVIVEESGKTHRQRVVVTEEGGRVSARLGSVEREAAQALTSQLKKAKTEKEQLIELSSDVADVTVACVLMPWGTSFQVVCSRVTDGALDAVVATRLPLAEGPREKALFALAEAALKQKADGWVGVGESPAGLRPLLYAGLGDRNAEAEPEPVPTSVVIGGVVAGVVGVAAVSGIVGVLVFNEIKRQQGFYYVVDISDLPPPPEE